jgi:glycine/D-amino acid oxidase-like deaminating enzyme
VAIVGAGLTGLWCAYYLLRDRPELSVVLLEAETAGFGASGRNGGWCSALFPTSLPGLSRLGDRAGALAQHAAMRATVDEVGRVLRQEGVDAHFHKGGTVTVARSAAQLQRARREVDEARRWDRGPDDLRLIDERAARGMLDAAGTIGATYTPDCAVVHPVRLVRGLADVVERSGGRIFEHTRALAIGPGQVTTERSSWCVRPRAIRPASLAIVGRSCRSTRSSSPPSRSTR